MLCRCFRQQMSRGLYLNESVIDEIRNNTSSIVQNSVSSCCKLYHNWNVWVVCHPWVGPGYVTENSFTPSLIFTHTPEHLIFSWQFNNFTFHTPLSAFFFLDLSFANSPSQKRGKHRPGGEGEEDGRQCPCQCGVRRPSPESNSVTDDVSV